MVVVGGGYSEQAVLRAGGSGTASSCTAGCGGSTAARLSAAGGREEGTALYVATTPTAQRQA